MIIALGTAGMALSTVFDITQSIDCDIFITVFISQWIL